MIDLTRDNNIEEEGAETPDATSGDSEGRQEPPTQTAAFEEPLPDAEDYVGGPESGQHHSSSLEWYLMKLLAPIEDTPRERVPRRSDEEDWDETPVLQPSDEEHSDELPVPEQLDATDPHREQDAIETPKGVKPLWQNTEEGVSEARAAAGATNPGTQPPPAEAGEMPLPRKREASKSKKRIAIRSLAHSERAGGGRQKLMTAMIPALVILIVVVLRHPLGARPTVKAAGGQPSETARPVITDVQIAWETPSPYDLSGRDLMKGTRSPVVAVESTGTAAVATEPPVELVVTGILYSLDNPAAIVDTQVVHEGQQISGATVEKIDKDGVQFERNGRKWKQTVNQ